MANDDSNPWRDMVDPGFDETSPTQAEVDHRQGYDDQGNKKRSSWGCLFYGCLTIVLLGIVTMLIVGVGGYYLVKGQVQKYTDKEPVAIATIEMNDEEIAAIEARLEAFGEMVSNDVPNDESADQPPEAAAIEKNAPPDPGVTELVLTAKEINALISKKTELKGHIFVRIEKGQISGDVSMPTDFLPLVGGGRYFNASATFDVSLDPAKNQGLLEVRLVDAKVKGQPLPQQFLDAIASENFAQDIYDDPKMAKMLDRFESLRIEGDRLILKVRPSSAEEIAKQEAEIEADAMPVPPSQPVPPLP